MTMPMPTEAPICAGRVADKECKYALRVLRHLPAHSCGHAWATSAPSWAYDRGLCPRPYPAVSWPHALDTAQALGWVVLDATLSGCLAEAHDLGLDAVPTRTGDSAVTSLSAVEPERAHPASLSAATGLGVMPLHTDGAYLRKPPDFTLLEAVRVDPMEDTLLWHISQSDVSDDALHGVFAVSGRGAPFAAHAIDSVGRIRFDPVCMRPRDRMARRAASWFSERAEGAYRHSWASRPGSVLVVDNRMTLHGRAAVTPGSSRELRRLMLGKRA